MAINSPMKLIGPANMDDPRFQRKLQAAGANPLRNQLGAVHDITAQFANQDMQTRLGFHQLGEADKRHESTLDLANRRLKMNRQQMDFNYKMQKQGLHDKRQENSRDMLLGLGTAGWAFIEGQRRAKLTAEDTKEKKELMALMKKYYGGTA